MLADAPGFIPAAFGFECNPEACLIVETSPLR